MYLTITPQTTDGNYKQSVTAFAEYLDKENEGKPLAEREAFFNQYNDIISRFEVIKDIDSNTKKLKHKDPKYYSITINPSPLELKAIENDKQALKDFTNKAMEDYASSFNREINGKPVTIDDIVYYAKLENERIFKHTETKVKENQPFVREMRNLEKKINKLDPKIDGPKLDVYRKEYESIFDKTPHKQNGKIIVNGMKKDGYQSHIHVIVSRKDRSNNYSLSPGSKYKASNVEMHGKTVKRGFDRDGFMKKTEERFDKMNDLKRHYAVSYQGRKDYKHNPIKYFKNISGLPLSQQRIASKFLRSQGLPGLPLDRKQAASSLLRSQGVPGLPGVGSIPVTPVQAAVKGAELIVKIGKKVIEASSIGI